MAGPQDGGHLSSLRCAGMQLLPNLKLFLLMLVMWLAVLYAVTSFSFPNLLRDVAPTKIIPVAEGDNPDPNLGKPQHEQLSHNTSTATKARTNNTKNSGGHVTQTNKAPTAHQRHNQTINNSKTVTTTAKKTTPNAKFNPPDTPKAALTEGVHKNVSHVCKFPNPDPFDPTIKNYVKMHPPIDCSNGVPNIAYLDGDIIRLDKEKIKKVLKEDVTFRHCQYTLLSRHPTSDLKVLLANASEYFNESIKLRETDEHMVVHCYDAQGALLSRTYLARVRERASTEAELQANYRKHLKRHSPKETLSILMIGIDGMSKQNFERTMPKTRSFLLNELQALELHKYSRLGLNTFPNVVPLLTGYLYPEVHGPLWNFSIPLDMINNMFLWTDFHKAGYRTGMMLDMTHITAFHYEKKGWLEKDPVDYYFRPLVVASEFDTKMRSNNNHCIGDTPEISLFHNFWVQLTSLFNNSATRPYFGYSFSCRLTHDDLNEASRGDDLYQDFLRQLHTLNVLNNTVLVFFSDHGERFGRIRSTYNGIIESSTPYIFFVFPDWFKKKYPDLMRVLKINQNRLTTHLDVYATMKDLLYFQGKSGVGQKAHRAISLFKEIPEDRTCQDMAIPPEYCLCRSLRPVQLNSNHSQAFVSKLVETVVKKTESERDKCAELRLKSVQSFLSVQLDSSTVQSVGNKSELYQVTIQTQPGDALYEALVQRSSDDTVSVLGGVVRLNMYRGQADCVHNPYVKMFCYCK